MGKAGRHITEADIIALKDYRHARQKKRAFITAKKKLRRLQVGPDAMFHFECYETVWHQIQEMLFIEKGGIEQLRHELDIYNPLIPNGAELVATVMFEIADKTHRDTVLQRLGGIETCMTLRVHNNIIQGIPEQDIIRSKNTGKTSAVHFIHFPFSEKQIADFRNSPQPIEACIHHEHYGHNAVMPDNIRQELAGDFI